MCKPNISDATLSAYTSITLPPFSHIMPFGGLAFDRLLDEQRDERIGNRRELDYINVTTYSLLHCGVGQRTPAWIVTHLGREGRVSEWARLEPGMAVRLFDEELSEKNYGFEKAWIFGTIGEPYGREPGYHIFWLDPHLFTITQHPIPVHTPPVLIAIPNRLLAKQYYLDRIC